jgi:preprotein translocase subunit SecE
VAKKSDKREVRKQPNAIRRYFNETIGELRKVSWPTRKEATNLTLVVLAVTLSMSLLLGFLDYIYSQFFALLLSTG